MRHTGVPRPLHKPTVGAEQVQGSKKARISPRLVAHASQQQAGIVFVLGVEPKRAIVALNEPFQPPAQLRHM